MWLCGRERAVLTYRVGGLIERGAAQGVAPRLLYVVAECVVMPWWMCAGLCGYRLFHVKHVVLGVGACAGLDDFVGGVWPLWRYP